MDNRTYFTNKKVLVSFALSLLVFFIHFRLFSAFNGASASLHRIFNIINSTTHVAVPLFLMLSGVMFYRNYEFKDTVKKWKSRFFSLCIPYLIWNAFWMFIALLGYYTPFGFLTGGVKAQFSVMNVLKGIFLNEYFEPFWFIKWLIVLTVLCPIIYALLRRKIVGIVMIVAVYILSCFDFVWLPDLSSVIFYLTGAWVGIHYFEFFTSRKKIRYAVFCIVIYIACCLFMGYKSSFDKWIFVLQIPTIVKLISCFAFWFLFDLININKCPRFLGYSFLIYAMHSFIGAALTKCMYMLVSSNPAFLPLIAVVSFSTTIIIICIFGYVLEKNMPKAKKLITGR